MLGTRCIANDGHECASLTEKTIDDWLSNRNIRHDKEPFYPVDSNLNPLGRMRADWFVEDVFIEYAGLMSRRDYAKKMQNKSNLANNRRIELIILTAEDLMNLGEELGRFIEKNS